MIKLNTIYLGDCLEVMKDIDDKSVDFVLTDLPYSVSAMSWDTPIDLTVLWKTFERILKPCKAVAMTATQPFTTTLINSKRDWFKYCWVWEKTKPSNFLNAKNRPLGIHEDIVIFSNGTIANKSPRLMKYNPQMTTGKPYKKYQKSDPRVGVWDAGNRTPYKGVTNVNSGTRYPQTIIKFANPNNHSLHPTEKPLALFEYLIKTYTDEQDVVLDCCCGSGTTCRAALNTNRQFIGIEKDQTFYDVAIKRIS